jgi:3-methyl-2-oxobutanoate hydroxymethyltransferase
MLPQHVLEEGGKYHVKGKLEAEHQRLLEDAKLLENTGVFAIVLELVTPPVAKEISEKISIPTIGIGSGEGCDGQILVTPDLIGMFPWFTPRFVKPRANCATEIKTAVAAWKNSLAKS